jgi:hypothetical protein
MQRLGLNPTEQEVVDIPNQIARKGLIYFPDFCQIVLERFRQSPAKEEDFRQMMFKVGIKGINKSHLLQIMCGTEPFPEDFRAKKYRLEKHALTKGDFFHIMKNLPVHVSDKDIEEMFAFADRDGDGRLSYQEFQVMVLPREPPAVPKPHVSDIGMAPQVTSGSYLTSCQVFSPPSPSSCPPPSNFASPLLPPSNPFSLVRPHRALTMTSSLQPSSRRSSLAASSARWDPGNCSLLHLAAGALWPDIVGS